jgi:rubrerythrin
MSLNEKQLDVLSKMAANEEMVGRLYRAYAGRFPKYNALWSGLAEEETKHAAMILKLISMVDSDSLFFKDGRFNKNAIKTFNNYLERETVKAVRLETPLIEALSTTLYIEDSLIEKKYFDVFETDSLASKQLLAKLSEDTRTHASKIREVLNKVKKS